MIGDVSSDALRRAARAAVWALGLGWATAATADPCGMVPPIWTGTGPEPVGIERAGLQNTYVFFDQGVETIAIRPGFTGTVDQFGMLVPLPSEPSLRKIDERTFAQMDAVVDPPVVTVHVYPERNYPSPPMSRAPEAAASGAAMEDRLALAKDEVRVVKEEAIGQYEVAVLEAGSAAALKRWMTQNAFRYPKGMDATVESYVAIGWMFVAVKTHVAGFAAVDAHPGMREVQPALPPGARFDGAVQGMAFRFEAASAVIPMRLSTFNGNDTHNRVYILANAPKRLAEIAPDTVRRQVSYERLLRNLTGPLRVRFDGPRDKIGGRGWTEIEGVRSPDPYLSVARDLFLSDLLAQARGMLSLPFEDKENELLRISESLGLRGAGSDSLHEQALAGLRDEALRPIARRLGGMSLTVIDGDFPRETLRSQNLTLASYTMPADKNRLSVWGSQPYGPELWISYRSW